MVTQNTPQRPPATWLTEAQIRHQPVGTIPYDGGSGSVRFLELPQAGYLSALQLVTTLSGNLNQVPSGVDGFAQVQGALAQVRLFVNTEGEMLDLDGFMLALVTALDDQYNNGDGQYYSVPQASFSINPAANTFTNQWIHRVPLAFYLRNVPYPLGLYNTALQNLTIRLQARWLPIPTLSGLIPGVGVYTGSATAPNTLTVANVTGQLDVNEEYFEPIPVQQAQPPLRYIHRWTQSEVPINVTNGVVEVPLPGRQRYMRIIYAVLDGASGAVTFNPNILTNLQLAYGVQSYPEDETVQQVGVRMRKQYGRLMSQLPPGVYTHDFVATTHDPRDWFNAGLTTNLRARLTFAGAHPGTGSKILFATEEMLTLRGAGFNNTAAALAAQQGA